MLSTQAHVCSAEIFLYNGTPEPKHRRAHIFFCNVQPRPSTEVMRCFFYNATPEPKHRRAHISFCDVQPRPSVGVMRFSICKGTIPNPDTLVLRFLFCNVTPKPACEVLSCYSTMTYPSLSTHVLSIAFLRNKPKSEYPCAEILFCKATVKPDH